MCIISETLTDAWRIRSTIDDALNWNFCTSISACKIQVRYPKCIWKFSTANQSTFSAPKAVAQTYQHSVNGSKSSGWHQTKASGCIKSENLIFCNFLMCSGFIRPPYFIFPWTPYWKRPFRVMKIKQKTLRLIETIQTSIISYVMIHMLKFMLHIMHRKRGKMGCW